MTEMKNRGGFEDPTFEAKAKDSRAIRGQGQTFRGHPLEAKGLGQSFTSCKISPKKKQKKGHRAGTKKYCCPRAEGRAFLRTCRLRGQGLQNVLEDSTSHEKSKDVFCLVLKIGTKVRPTARTMLCI